MRFCISGDILEDNLNMLLAIAKGQRRQHNTQNNRRKQYCIKLLLLYETVAGKQHRQSYNIHYAFTVIVMKQQP